MNLDSAGLVHVDLANSLHGNDRMCCVWWDELHKKIAQKILV